MLEIKIYRDKIEISSSYWERLESVNKRKILSMGWNRYGQTRM